MPDAAALVDLDRYPIQDADGAGAAVLELAERVLVIEGGQVAKDLTAAQFAEETGAWVRLRLRRERWPWARAALLHAGLDPADFEVEGLSWRSPRSPQ